VWTVRSARVFLDRVSFRLLLSCLVWEIVYDVNYISVSPQTAAAALETGSPSVQAGTC
jgi:hypothetical protein